MMIAQQRFGRILVYGRPVDMRNGFDGLEAVVRAGLGEDPLSGDLFVFILCFLQMFSQSCVSIFR